MKKAFLFQLFVILFVTIFCALGTWQLYRLQWKLELISEITFGLDSKPISLHVRRTDYTTNPNHTALVEKYYKNALTCFNDTDQVIVFSDDPIWCHDSGLFSEDRFLIAEGNSGYVDMCLMTMCKGHIIANSSFSWWGAWLADSKMVVAPSIWFGPNNSHLDIKDLYLDHWEVI